MLTKLGFDPNDDFVQIITSGDVSHRMLAGEDASSLGCSTWDVLDECQQRHPSNRPDDDDDDDAATKKVFCFGSGDGDHA